MYLATTSYTSLVFMGPGRESSVAASCLPVETSLSYFSPCLWTELLFQLREKYTNMPDVGKALGETLYSVVGLDTAPLLVFICNKNAFVDVPLLKHL